MILSFKNTDFDYVEQTINGMILYSMCSFGVINAEKNCIKEDSFKLFLQALVKDDSVMYDKFLDDVYDKVNKSESSMELKKFFYSINKLYLLTKMTNRNDFRSAVESNYLVFNEQDTKVSITYLYRDKTTVQEKKENIMYYNSLNFIKGTKLILEKTKEIAVECVNKSLIKF